ncbi:Gfo/Idh/MocA family protein [Szabonella alba]|uniref:Gfo/Idh/MocA family oxidoreductase n=1 Tax=Szabonella alba TaxID=2804194 RepID=A0A8K0Y108_9RHOB|nr:Gfo/Idh/MocA family oxidoreductase [Szabonella alba]MBL4917673.1 Gfo/Idh/MocA family oxidoreductase [Szabonella alba]
MAKFGIGVLGAGLAAAPHFRSLADLAPDVDLRGVFCRTEAGRKAAQERYGVPVVSRLEDLLEDPAVDALLVLTPPDQRMEVVRAAVAAGKALLVEKPVERDTAAASEIVDLCAQAGLPLGVIFQHRFREGALALRDLMDKGGLGRLGSVSLQVPWWRPQSYYDEPGRGTKARDGGGVLITQAIHMLDLMLSVTGPAAEVQAMTATTRHRMETEDFAAAAIRFENGAMGSVMATTASYPGGQEILTLNCEKGTAHFAGGVLRVDWIDGGTETFGAVTASGGGANIMDFPHEWHRAQIADFIDAVQTGRAPRSNGQSALHVHRLIDAILRSSETGQRCSVT